MFPAGSTSAFEVEAFVTFNVYTAPPRKLHFQSQTYYLLVAIEKWKFQC